MNYTCEHCNKQFSQKGDLTRHTNKKNACIPISSVVEKIEQKTVQNSNVSEVMNIFKSIMNILRNDASHITGDEVLFEMSHFLILKMVEPLIVDKTIDIYNLSYYSIHDINNYGEEEFISRLELVKPSKFFEYANGKNQETGFSNKEKLKMIYDEFLWNVVLSKHPMFHKIFEEGQKSRIKESKTIFKILEILHPINFEKYNFDVLGEAYEGIFVDAVFGAGQSKKGELGQFFTPTKVKKLLVSLVEPKLLPNCELESVFDPSCGTGGILNTVIKHYKTFVNETFTENSLRIQLMDKIYGIEIKDKIFNLCMSNMLVNTGKVLQHVIAGDSIRDYHSVKVDTIVANPPFSVKIEYDELHKTLKHIDNSGQQIAGDELLKDYIPIKACGKNSELLFIQMMIHCLKIEGRCATVMLDGDKIYGTSSGYDNVRQYLLRSCDLHKVIMCPSGTFTSTATKTCILFFTKKQEREKVVSWKIKGKSYDWKGKFSTKTVEFLDYNPDTEQLYPLINVGINDIISKNFSLRYSDYVVEEEKEEVGREGNQRIQLDEICDFQNGYAFKSSDYQKKNNNNIGIISIKAIQNGIIEEKKITEYHINYESFDKFKVKKNDLLIALSGATTGKIGFYHLDDESYLNQRVGKFIFNDKMILPKYFYYWYIGSNIEKYVLSLSKGTAQPNVSTKTIGKLKIPLPPIEQQQKIVEFLYKIYENKEIKIQDTVEYFGGGEIFNLLLDGNFESFERLIKWQENNTVLLKKNIIACEEDIQTYLQLSTKKFKNISLKEVCDFQNGKGLSKNLFIDGLYPVIGGGQKPIGFHNEFNRKENTILCSSSGAYAGFISKYSKKIWASDCFSIIPKNNDILNNEYLFLFLKLKQNEIYKFQNGAAQPHVYSKDLSKIYISIPSLEQQQKIIDECQKYKDEIEKIEQKIIEKKLFAQEFLQNCLNNIESDEQSVLGDFENLDLQDNEDNDFSSEESIQSDTNENIQILHPIRKSKRNKNLISPDEEIVVL